jgi:glycosyltransferase involved in cell wall biosynthesis
MQPKVSIILPVYNGEAYILKAVNSMLRQTFADFECIIIDDCSTDQTVELVNTLQDNRIKLIVKPNNTGYVKSLNMGIQLATGTYIARMDADDIALPERLGKQVDYLDNHPETAVVATKIKLMDENDTLTGDWKNDQLTHTAKDIVQYLPKGNCICHPSIMARKEILDKYPYDTNQYGSEDWDLWLRLTADGYRIEKLPDVLLQYRTTNTSVSAVLDTSLGVLQKANIVRRKYLAKRFKSFRLTQLDLRVCFYLLHTQLRIMKQFLTSTLFHSN